MGNKIWIKTYEEALESCILNSGLDVLYDENHGRLSIIEDGTEIFWAKNSTIEPDTKTKLMMMYITKSIRTSESIRPSSSNLV
jgi:hypothetical protein